MAELALVIGIIAGVLAILGYVCGAFRWVWERLKGKPKPKEEVPPPTPPPPVVTPEKPSSIFSVPYARNPNFTGRESLLGAVREALEGGEAAALTQAIVGLGGVGKTQLALEYAYRHREDYDVVWWVRSEGPELAGDYGGLAVRLGLIGEDVPNQREIVAAARGWLEVSAGWLLILDNVESAQAIYDYLPRGGDGHVLITCRSQAFGEVAKAVEVPEFPRPESVAFLKKRTGQDEGADALAEEVGDLPLALEQAAAYVEATACTLTDYVDLFRTSRETLWKNEKPPLGYSKTVGTTWAVAMDRVEEECAPAADLLNLCAFLAPEDIPLDVIREHAELVPDGLAEAVGDKGTLNEMKAALRRYSLVRVETEAETLSVHRLVQAVTRDRLSQEDRRTWAAAAARLVSGAFPHDSDDVRSWPVCARLLPHALAAAHGAADLEVALDAAGHLLNQAGAYLRGRAELAPAKTASERALAVAEKAYGSDHPKVAIRLNNLANVRLDLGHLPAARECLERALTIDEKAYGPDHPTVAVRLSNLGRVLRAEGNLLPARQRSEQALAIFERTQGPEHPDVATALGNLASVLRDQGDLPGARKHVERALAIDEKAYGPDHPKVAVHRNDLGVVLRDQGDLSAAREHLGRALAIDEKAFGPHHPTVAIRVGNLGLVLQDQGDLRGARQCSERALAIFEKTHGKEHPQVATAVSNLGLVLQEMGDLEGAKERFERALAIDEKAYGPDHPDVATGVNNLGLVLQQTGDLKGAREHYERALAILVKFLGEEHPNTQLVRGNLEGLGEGEGD